MINNQRLFDGAKPAGFDGLFEWDWLKGAFGPAIMPMDFDAVVERAQVRVRDDREPVPIGFDPGVEVRTAATGPKPQFIVEGGLQSLGEPWAPVLLTRTVRWKAPGRG